MTARCLSCADREPDAGNYHARCLRDLFGTPVLPDVDVDLARLHTLALAMVGRVSVSGAQRKLSVEVSADRATLQVSVGGGRFILKPQSGVFPHLPENEWTTQRLATLSGIAVPPGALVPLCDGSRAYVVRRFDRLADGRKLPMEDFCQLSGHTPGEKYDSSAEQCAHLVRRFADEPLIELLRLYRLLVFSWWVGNGDLHLKNLALIADPEGRYRLSPAYDQLNTRLVIPADPLALPVCGRRDNLKTATWYQLAARIGLAERAARRVLGEVAGALPTALELLRDAPLPGEMREAYADLLRERAAALAG